ncbi:unnamed protein product, partial [marine sediment metagenome]
VVHQPGYDNIFVIPPINTSKGELWKFKVWMYDGENYSTVYQSSSVLILNSAPTTSSVSFLDTSVLSNETLVANWGYSDVDGDPEVGASALITWYKDNTHQSSYDNVKTILANDLTKGDVWNYTLQVYDGTDYSTLANSAEITILNTPPVVQTPDFTVSNPTSGEDLIATWGYYDSDGDSQNTGLANITWYKNGIHQSGYNNITAVNSSDLIRNDFWNYIIQVSDGTDYSPSVNSSIKTILNSLPSASDVGFNETSPVPANFDFNISFTYFDADNDN